MYNVLGMLITGEPVIKDADSKSNYTRNNKVNVEAKKKDILYDFPYDVNYPTDKMVRDNLKYWEGTEESERIDNLEYWDKERADAARGKLGIIARRCSVNGLLWAEFKTGAFPDQQTLKNRIKLDHIRMALYPMGTGPDKICVEAPSKDYWEKLKDSKDLHRYIRELTTAGFTSLSDVIPMTEELEKIANDVREELKKEEVTKNG